jgi:hypothetical protein
MNHIIGDSRVRGLKMILSGVEVSEIWSRPGGKIEHMKRMVDDIIILHQGEENARTHIYIWVGICNITKRIKEKKYEEVIFSKAAANKEREDLFVELQQLSTHIYQQYAAPIFCPIIAMDLRQWNEHRLASKKTTVLKYADQYSIMQKDLEHEVAVFNQHLIKMNVENGLTTPMINQDFLHSRGKGRVTPRYRELVDGCHPSGPLLMRFKKSITKAMKKNKSILRS